MPFSGWTEVSDYKVPGGWVSSVQAEARSREYCQALERGEILFFSQLPFPLPLADREFLLAQQWAELRMHKNVSYRPGDDTLRGLSGHSR